MYQCNDVTLAVVDVTRLAQGVVVFVVALKTPKKYRRVRVFFLLHNNVYVIRWRVEKCPTAPAKHRFVRAAKLCLFFEILHNTLCSSAILIVCKYAHRVFFVYAAEIIIIFKHHEMYEEKRILYTRWEYIAMSI